MTLWAFFFHISEVADMLSSLIDACVNVIQMHVIPYRNELTPDCIAELEKIHTSEVSSMHGEQYRTWFRYIKEYLITVYTYADVDTRQNSIESIEITRGRMNVCKVQYYYTNWEYQCKIYSFLSNKVKYIEDAVKILKKMGLD